MPAVEKPASDTGSHSPRRGFGTITRKLIFTVALIPLVPSVSGIATILIDEFWRSGPWPDNWLRWYHFCFASLWVGALLLIWRNLVIWTAGRKWLTLFVAVIPFVQVIHGMHWWGDAGCARGEILRAGQHNLGVGVGTWLMVWVWWGWEKTKMAEDRSAQRQPVGDLPPVVPRVAMSIGLIPVTVGSFVLMTMLIGEALPRIGEEKVLPLAMLISAILAVFTWMRIWRGAVMWTAWARMRSVLDAGLLIGVPIALIPLTAYYFPGIWSESSSYWLPVVGWGLWMVWTGYTWTAREPAGSGGAKPKCLNCGYLLIGLTSTRCPECGDEPTLDELWGAPL